jgi:hypothetical protein
MLAFGTRAFVSVAVPVLVCLTFSSAAAADAHAQARAHIRVQNSFKAALIADALALGGHYEYDAAKIKSRGGFQNFQEAGKDNHGVGWGTANYHPGKKAGDLTDAGDVAMMLLRHLAQLQRSNALSTYSFDTFAAYWKREIDAGYGSCNFQSVPPNSPCPPGTKPGYINGGSRRTLQALQQQPAAVGVQRKQLAANVNCLVAATHFLPLFLTQRSETELVAAAVDTVFISHNSPDPIAAAEFLTRALWRIIHLNLPLQQALEQAAALSSHQPIRTWLQAAISKVAESLDPSSALSQQELVDDIAITSMARLWDVGKSEPIKVGKASPTEGALPAALYFALKYSGDYERAVVANANVGGDSAARGVVIGMLLGAADGWYLPPTHRWVTGLNVMHEAEVLMKEVAAGGAGEL